MSHRRTPEKQIPTQRASLKKAESGQKKLFEYKQQNIPHSTQMLQHPSTTSENSGVVNNIFISNLNINLNLNINISIPPSPLSTKGNGSRLESIHSEEELKDFKKL